jgi:acetylornithine deacetylase/succinyl-diaminopimelate desuccinylase-like protein
VVKAVDAIRYFPKLDAETARLFGEELYMVAGRIYGGLPPDGPSMIPDRCTIRVDTRPQPGVPLEEVQGVIERALDELKARDPELKTELVVADVKRSHWIAPDQPIVRYTCQAVEMVTGQPATLHGVSWLGDTASFGQKVPTVIFGPGREPIYMPNEYLDLEDIAVATRVYALTTALALDAR